MSIEDQLKWDEKYVKKPKLLQDRDHSKKLELALELVQGKDALEVACGSGRNSIFLAKNGFNIDAFDIAQIALDTLDAKGYSNINTQQMDLDHYTPQKNSYDLIVKTNFLDRDLIPKLLLALKLNGVLFIETYMDHPSNTKPDSNPDFLLQKEELKIFVTDDFEIVEYDEFDNEPHELHRMKKQSIIIKRVI